MSTHCTHHLRGLCKYSAKCAKCTVVQTVLRLCKHPAGCTRLCKYSAEVACCKNLFQIVEIFCKTCRFYKVVQIFCRNCSCCTKPSSGCANILQKCSKLYKTLQVVQTFCRSCSCCTNPPHRLCKHSAAMTQVQLTPTDHPRLRTLLAFTIFLKTILSKIRIETRLLCLPLFVSTPGE